MIHVNLERFCYSDQGTFGHISLPSGIELISVERPWLDNKRMVSCIPVGNYQCSPRMFYRGGYEAVEIKGVPDRSHILFHVANFPNQVNGCVGVNSTLGAHGNQWCGWNSKRAFDQFMDELGGKDFELSITNLSAGVYSA